MKLTLEKDLSIRIDVLNALYIYLAVILIW